jgi:protein TonB
MGTTAVHFSQTRHRFELALAASVLLHAVLCTVFVLETPMRERPAAGFTPITVHIRPQAPQVSVEALVPTGGPSLPAVVPQKPRVAPAATDLFPESNAAATVALPQAPDPTYYSARDLDTYPRPAAPLELDRIAADAGTSSIRLILLIDEGGSVNEIKLVEPAAPGPLQEAVRGVLAATRFIPGRKDGRAVKSRVLLDVTVGPGRREP